MIAAIHLKGPIRSPDKGKMLNVSRETTLKPKVGDGLD